MATILYVFFPSFISLAVYDFLDSHENGASLYRLIIRFGVFCSVNNLLAFFAYSFLFKQSVLVVQGQFVDGILSKRFLLLHICISVITGLVARILFEIKKLQLQLEVEKKGREGKNEKK